MSLCFTCTETQALQQSVILQIILQLCTMQTVDQGQEDCDL